jgi:hypothetical protein
MFLESKTPSFVGRLHHFTSFVVMEVSELKIAVLRRKEFVIE